MCAGDGPSLHIKVLFLPYFSGLGFVFVFRAIMRFGEDWRDWLWDGRNVLFLPSKKGTVRLNRLDEKGTNVAI